ncbi:hypothetical protein LDENG_00181360 [Lucifuga dentata]|nr:hypothetical protein LDENG_00181360 [Lucifuga dentata]
MPTADCRLLHHGRIMRCLTYLLLLPETLKKSKKVGKHPVRLPVCYEILSLSLSTKKQQQQHKKKKKEEEEEEKEKMAAELYPASTNNTNLANGTTVADTEKTKEAPQNITNNNVDPPSWQCSHPTLRERNALMFNNELMADVHFIVGPLGASQKVPAHKVKTFLPLGEI